MIFAVSSVTLEYGGLLLTSGISVAYSYNYLFIRHLGWSALLGSLTYLTGVTDLCSPHLSLQEANLGVLSE